MGTEGLEATTRPPPLLLLLLLLLLLTVVVVVVVVVAERTKTPRRRRAGVRNDLGTGRMAGTKGDAAMPATTTLGLAIVMGGTGFVMRGRGFLIARGILRD
jgi:hypothetical protein